MNMREKEISREYLFSGKVIKLRFDKVELPNGDEASREIIEHPGGVCVVALTDDGKILLVRQYRRPFDDILLEIPAGKLNPGEDHRECGLRELEEETGYTAQNFEYLGGFYPTPGFCNEIIHIYFASGLKKGRMHLDEDEFLENEQMDMEEVCNLINQGVIKDAKTVMGVLLLKNIMNNR